MSRRANAWEAFYGMVDKYLDRMFHARAMLIDTDGKEVKADIDEYIEKKAKERMEHYDSMTSDQLRMSALMEMVETIARIKGIELEEEE